MNKFLKSFTDKKFRYGAFSTLTVIFIIAILVVVNLVVGQFNISFDLSQDQMYSISQTSKDIVAEITDDVTLYVLFKTGDESLQSNLQVKRLLEEYENASKHVSIIYKDPYLYPQFVENYKQGDSTIAADSVIVESAKRYKVIAPSDMYTYAYDYNTYSQYIDTIDIEPQITNAIRYVTAENTSIIYQITNHNELTVNDTLKKQIDSSNYELKDLDLFSAEAVPEDASMIISTTPERDWTPDEAEKMKAYLENDGRAMFFIDFALEEMPNFSQILNSYGVENGMNVIFEGNSSNTLQGMPIYILPNQEQHDIMTSLISKKYPNLVIASTSINTLGIVKNSIKIEPLLTTSNASYAKSDVNSQSSNKEAGDAEGPFNIAVAITDSYYTEEQHYTKLVVVGTSSFMDASVDSVVSGSNSDFILSSINWLHDKTDTVYIRPKSGSTSMSQLVMNDAQGTLLSAIAMFVVPGSLIVIGIVVWLRRRNR